MSEITQPNNQAKPLPTPLLVVAGLLVPGAAQLLQGRKFHALLLGIPAIVTFFVGMLISSFTAIDPANHEVYLLLQSGLPLLTWGLQGLGMVAEPLIGETVTVQAQTIGICFTSVAGLCNLLTIFEALRHDPKLRLPSEKANQSTSEAKAEGAVA